MRWCKTASMTRAPCSGGACGDAAGENGNAGSDGGHADASYLPLMTRLLSRVVPGFVLQFGISGYCLFLHLSFD